MAKAPTMRCNGAIIWKKRWLMTFYQWRFLYFHFKCSAKEASSILMQSRMNLEVKLYSFIFCPWICWNSLSSASSSSNYKNIGLRLQYILKYFDKPGPQIHLLRGVWGKGKYFHFPNTKACKSRLSKTQNTRNRNNKPSEIHHASDVGK